MIMQEKIMVRQADRRTREMMIGGLLMRYGFLTRDTIGESRCARPIDLLCVGNRRKQVLFAGAFHGMEWLTSMILLKFLDELCFSVMTGQAMCGVKMGVMLNQRGLAVIPCVNPDGVEIQIHGEESAGEYEELVKSAGNTSKWQANAAGVDINHNCSANWDKLKRLELENNIKLPSPTRYGGEFAESEPETRSIASYCRAGNITHALAFHSQGEEIYWSYGKNTPQKGFEIAEKMSKLSGSAISFPS